MNKFVSETPDLTFDDVLINPERSSISSRFDNEQCFPYVYHGEGNFLPIVSSPMDSIPSREFIEAASDRLMTIFTCRFLPFEQQLEQIAMAPGRVGGVIGVNTTPGQIEKICNAGATDILLDVANGGNENIIKVLSNVELQSRRSNSFRIWAGNVANAEGYRMLAEHCDFVRVGIGNGSACTTRINTGVGRGTVTSLLECRQVYEELSRMNPGRKYAKLVADGGLKYNGDFGKSYVAGAHVVMSGRIFAQTYESATPFLGKRGDHVSFTDIAFDKSGVPYISIKREDKAYAEEFGEFRMIEVDRDYPTFKTYRGMASRAVNEEAGRDMSRVSVEGASGLVNISGPVNHVLNGIEGNLRSTISYVGASSVSELYEKGRFAIVSPSVTIENRAHGFD